MRMARFACEHCGSGFTAPPSSGRKYCGRDCYDEASGRVRVSNRCDRCGTGFSAKPSRANQRYCSHECMYADRAEHGFDGGVQLAGSDNPRFSRVEMSCEQCGADYLVERRHAVDSRFCSVECKAAYQSDPERMAARFWDGVDKQPGDGCWEWTGHCNDGGYGRVTRQTEDRLAHRYAWELENGPIPDGMFVCHHCDNPPCVRPDHLFLGTHTDNMRDAQRKGRRPTAEREAA